MKLIVTPRSYWQLARQGLVATWSVAFIVDLDAADADFG